MRPAGLLLPPDLCVLEVKVVSAVPWWLAVAISRHELTLHPTSKYRLACELAGVPALEPAGDAAPATRVQRITPRIPT